VSASTAKYGLPYSIGADAVSTVDDTMQALANRLDLLLGESGVWAPNLVANTAQTTAITLSRTYPGNSGGSPPGIVIVNTSNSVASGVNVQTWVGTWVGTGTTITGFTLGAISSAAGVRNFQWRFIPVL
jgi:hypothetical protein